MVITKQKYRVKKVDVLLRISSKKGIMGPENIRVTLTWPRKSSKELNADGGHQPVSEL